MSFDEAEIHKADIKVMGKRGKKTSNFSPSIKNFLMSFFPHLYLRLFKYLPTDLTKEQKQLTSKILIRQPTYCLRRPNDLPNVANTITSNTMNVIGGNNTAETNISKCSALKFIIGSYNRARQIGLKNFGYTCKVHGHLSKSFKVGDIRAVAETIRK